MTPTTGKEEDLSLSTILPIPISAEKSNFSAEKSNFFVGKFLAAAFLFFIDSAA
jgi:hypothetical protein